MSIRNFWIDADIDGRNTPLASGPRSKDGGFTATIYIRDDSDIKRAVTLIGDARSNGELTLAILPAMDLSDKTFGPECLCCADNECECKGEKISANGFTITTKR